MEKGVLLTVCFRVSADRLILTQASPSTPTPPHGQRLDALSSVLPLVRFQCQGRAGGYYGDMDFGCSVFHYCGDSGERFSYKCTDGLKFNEVCCCCCRPWPPPPMLYPPPVLLSSLIFLYTMFERFPYFLFYINIIILYCQL